MTQQVAWQPQPRQIEALTRMEQEVLFGGARGGGKTDCGMAWLLYDIPNPRYRALVVRRNADDLKDWIDRASFFYAPCGGVKSGQPPEIKFPSGATIRTGHLRDENAYTKYQGHEYQKIVIEELTHISREDDYEKLLGSNRSTLTDITPQVFSTTNPDGPGYEWVKKRWNIPDQPKGTVVTPTNGRGRVFIPAKLEDNPILLQKDPNYIHYLDTIRDPDLRRAWREGYWGGISVKGAYYADQLSEAKRLNRITTVPYDTILPVHTVWDLGVGDATAIGFYQRVNMEVRMIDYYENNGFGLEHYVKVLKEKKYIYGSHFAPFDIQVREFGTGKSRLEIAHNFGIDFEIVPRMSREDRIESARQFWSVLWIDKVKCEDFINLIGQYHKVWDDKRGFYKDEPCHDWTSNGADQFSYASLVVDKFLGSNRIYSAPPTYDDLHAPI